MICAEAAFEDVRAFLGCGAMLHNRWGCLWRTGRGLGGVGVGGVRWGELGVELGVVGWGLLGLGMALLADPHKAC